MSIPAMTIVKKKFDASNKREGFWQEHDRLLIGISGGPDSVALAHLGLSTGLNIGLAHINYKLRGQDSEEDESFVRSLASRWEIPVYVRTFDTKQIAKEQHLTLQETARNLRYAWWAELIESEGYTRILTGHQADDQLETILLALLRGGGLQGLQGIPARRGVICRPMLEITRAEILEYLDLNALPYRVDASNLGDDYLRNKIRHHLTPLLETLRPGLAERVASNSKHTASGIKAAQWSVSQVKPLVFTEKGTAFTLDFKQLRAFPFFSFALFTLLTPYGYTPQQIESMCELEPGNSGQLFLSPKYRIVYDRGILRGELNEDPIQVEQQIIPLEEGDIQTPFGMLVLKQVEQLPEQIPNDPNILYLDIAKILGPMTLRGWQFGDKIQPLGMKGRQKVKTLLTDRKVDRHSKERTLLLTVGDEIWWVLGQRVAEPARISPLATKILQLSWQIAD